MSNDKKYCENCHDGEGGSVFPYYGLAPHTHTKAIGGTVFSSEPLPENYRPDINDPFSGIYTHCMSCGAGK